MTVLATRQFTGSLVFAVALTSGAAGCGMFGDEGSETSTAADTPDDDFSAREPAPSVTETVTPPPSAPVLLTDQGVGAVSFSSPGAYDQLVALLGEASSPIQESCSYWYASWDALTVYFDDQEFAGTAIGWGLRGGRLADQIEPPFGVYPGDSVSPILDEGGVMRPLYNDFDNPETVTEYRTSIGGYTWDTPTDDADSPVSYITANDSSGCD